MYRKIKEVGTTPWPIQQYARTVMAKPSGKSNTLPTVILKKDDIAIQKGKVARYSEVCEFTQNTGHAPVTFPHILAFALHMELLLEKGFPYKLMGLVHINNTITQYKRIPIGSKLTIEVSFDELQDHDKGKVISIITKAYTYGELVWESRSENLKRIGKSDNKEAKKVKEPAAALEGQSEHWKLDTISGIRYAFAGGSGDFNPIHLLPITAKPFGFKRHIIHGMWTKARALAALESVIGDRPHRVHVDFKLPIYLPNEVTFTHAESSTGIHFEVRDKSNEKPHLKGEVTYL